MVLTEKYFEDLEEDLKEKDEGIKQSIARLFVEQPRLHWVFSIFEIAVNV